MNASVDSAGVQTLPLVGTGAVAVAPLAAEAEAKAKASPHPNPLPQAGEGAGRPLAEVAPATADPLPFSLVEERTGHPLAEAVPAAADPLPLPLAGEGWGEGKTEAEENTAVTTANQAVANQSTTATITQPTDFAQPPSGAGMVGTTVLTLTLVIGFILLLAWLAKRMPGIGSASNPALKIVGSLPLGPRERVVVVAVGETQLLLATGPNGTRTLHTLEQPLPVAAASTTPSPFAQLLAQQFGKKKQ